MIAIGYDEMEIATLESWTKVVMKDITDVLMELVEKAKKILKANKGKDMGFISGEGIEPEEKKESKRKEIIKKVKERARPPPGQEHSINQG